jgi:hypothetical protein
MKSRDDMAEGEKKIETFLIHMAVDERVAAATQNNALVFLYNVQLGSTLVFRVIRDLLITKPLHQIEMKPQTQKNFDLTPETLRPFSHQRLRLTGSRAFRGYPVEPVVGIFLFY